jgi:hypothetical protein
MMVPRQTRRSCRATARAALASLASCALAIGCYSSRSIGVDVGLAGSWNHDATGFWPNRIYTNTNVSYADLVSFGAYVAHDDEAFALWFTPDVVGAVRKAAGEGNAPLRFTVVPMAGLWISHGESEPIYGYRGDFRWPAGGDPTRLHGFSFGHGHRPETPDWRYFIRYSYVREW